MEESIVERLVSGLEEEPSVSIRLNPALGFQPEISGSEPVPWSEYGLYLKERPVFTADPLFHAGAYYVQEASSMFIGHVVKALMAQAGRTWARCLDLCAAPGGKTTLLRSVLPSDCLLVSNEPIRTRALVLAENVAKWGEKNIFVSQAYPADFAPFYDSFDLILADVPCSGEGMMRREDEAVAQWSPALVADCAVRQQGIIADIWPTLRPGGFLIYSTCTFNHEEDEDNVEWIVSELGGEVVPIATEAEWNIDGDLRPGGTLPCFHFLPGSVRGEGFFCAAIRKCGETNIEGTEESVIDRAEVRSWDDRHSTKDKRAKKGNSKSAKRDHRTKTFADQMAEHLALLPTNQLDSPEAPRVELNIEDAFRYLRGESLVLEGYVPKGIVQVCYSNQRLGLVKNIGNRANNLYPKAWRILSSHIRPKSLFSAQET
ncbi:MAG: hypothetical protein K6F94_07390 [Bacteroidaceae bacterium]|nr:hypothetical protein [Bacteroidaceae bacterium]